MPIQQPPLADDVATLTPRANLVVTATVARWMAPSAGHWPSETIPSSADSKLAAATPQRVPRQSSKRPTAPTAASVYESPFAMSRVIITELDIRLTSPTVSRNIAMTNSIRVNPSGRFKLTTPRFADHRYHTERVACSFNRFDAIGRRFLRPPEGTV